ncbi:hypothetical protein DI09_17p270 [Mitosporidium daphniae]|uniref:Protein kinase domain-containing protein n=1 Tax=Mitosporidium daphniae TaxID=1485682 RepID=A0A098VTX3_9MICR|nr:uncharacterized protein DI09_17p270 [Mitosporidium daphniae]KGG52397.1 hypothetical protein DI09_17p270 [Mitosporidium daphniae]|eukprot:XP_013238824.1 uncharacterized protein DI09_17p270 [Mitosporidium daphniae]
MQTHYTGLDGMLTVAITACICIATLLALRVAYGLAVPARSRSKHLHTYIFKLAGICTVIGFSAYFISSTNSSKNSSTDSPTDSSKDQKAEYNRANGLFCNFAGKYPDYTWRLKNVTDFYVFFNGSQDRTYFPSALKPMFYFPRQDGFFTAEKIPSNETSSPPKWIRSFYCTESIESFLKIFFISRGFVNNKPFVIKIFELSVWNIMSKSMFRLILTETLESFLKDDDKISQFFGQTTLKNEDLVQKFFKSNYSNATEEEQELRNDILRYFFEWNSHVLMPAVIQSHGVNITVKEDNTLSSKRENLARWELNNPDAGNDLNFKFSLEKFKKGILKIPPFTYEFKYGDELKIIRYFDENESKDFRYPKGLLIDLQENKMNLLGYMYEDEYAETGQSLSSFFESKPETANSPQVIEAFKRLFASINSLRSHNISHGNIVVTNIFVTTQQNGMFSFSIGNFKQFNQEDPISFTSDIKSFAVSFVHKLKKEMESEKCNPVLLQITLEYSNVIEDPELKISHIADYKTKEKTCDYHPQ